MNPRRFCTFLLLLAPPLIAADGPTVSDSGALKNQPWLQGLSLDVRARYEFADQDRLDASHAGTVRTRLGYTLQPLEFLRAHADLENIVALDPGAYNQAGLNRQPRKTPVADPEVTELNQAWLEFSSESVGLKAGRQRVILGNHRFVGNVGWRQNEQTFDAASLVLTPTPDLTLTYAYLDQINRVFGRKHPQGRLKSDSHLVDARLKTSTVQEIGAYYYRLVFPDSSLSSADTAGIQLRHGWPTATSLYSVLLEGGAQWQNRGSASAEHFRLPYFRAEGTARRGRGTAGLGWERLGGNNRRGLQTPLATLHAFNGWADAFLTTPASGLQEYFVFAQRPLPQQLAARLSLHHFTPARNSRTLGQELDFQLTRPITDNLTALAKAALFDGKQGRPDATKLWLQFEFKL